MAAVRNLGTRNRLKAGTNPIRRGSIAVSGIDAELYVYEIDGEDNNPSTDRRDLCIKVGEQAAEMSFLGSEVQRLNRQIADNSKMAARRDAVNRHLMHKMSKNIAQIASAPRRRVAVVPANVSNAVVADVARPSPLVASLIARPRTLHDLWAEW